MFIINEYYERNKSGESFEAKKFYSGFLEGFDCYFEEVDQQFYEEYMGQALCLYKNTLFPAFQLIYPTTSGIYPSDINASDDFKVIQPTLTSSCKTQKPFSKS